MTRRYAILDVFTATPLEGNALAVVLDADGLDDRELQRIAAEFSLSETVFVYSPENPVHTARLRIFTPQEELPFAGHPTVGTAVLLASNRTADGADDMLIVLEESIGPVRCGVTLHAGGAGGHAWFDAPKLPLSLDRALNIEHIAAALSLSTDDIGFEAHIPSAYGAGADFVFIPVRNLEAIGRAAPNTAAWMPAFGETPAWLYTHETEVVGRQFHARMFAPALGIAEDPATGSAAAAFAAVAHRFEAMGDGTHTIVIEQGFEMNRPSIISLELDLEGDAITEVRIGGKAVIVAEGDLRI